MKTLINIQFDAKIAKETNTDSAIIYDKINRWCNENMKNNKNNNDGKFWVKISIRDFKKHFAYLSEKQIRRCLEKLKDKGYLNVGNYNVDKFDKTKWYSIK